MVRWRVAEGRCGLGIDDVDLDSSLVLLAVWAASSLACMSAGVGVAFQRRLRPMWALAVVRQSLAVSSARFFRGSICLGLTKFRRVAGIRFRRADGVSASCGGAGTGGSLDGENEPTPAPPAMRCHHTPGLEFHEKTTRAADGDQDGDGGGESRVDDFRRQAVLHVGVTVLTLSMLAQDQSLAVADGRRRAILANSNERILLEYMYGRCRCSMCSHW